jgi:glycosyltransferase involved in cell wall biosynthesis
VKTVFFFDPDGYSLTGPKLMGRQSAGAGFLRAAIKGAGETPVAVSVMTQSAAKAFQAHMETAGAGVRYEILAARNLDQLAQADVYFRPDVVLTDDARWRLRMGPAAYSLCGLTHTLASDRVMDVFARLPFEPLMAWDALICTSKVARAVLTRVFDEAEAQHRWRTGEPTAALPRPMLPIIPLGVHCEDYAFSKADQAAARAELGLDDDTVAALSSGRISMNAKAHPLPMMTGLQAAAQRLGAGGTGRKLALIIAGQAETQGTLEMFRRAAAELCPDVRTIFVDGADAGRYRQTWAAADIFMSLSDNIQETFGLTPIEAMAAGLPALVSDWNGYKDTVRDGIDGFRVPTWAPEPGGGERLSRDFQTGEIAYGMYLARASSAVAVDIPVLAERLDALIVDADLRRRMGAAGQARAREAYDWAVVYAQYRELWTELDAIRRRAQADPKTAAWLAAAPRRSPDHLGPFDAFESFPTRHVGPRTVVGLGSVASSEAYRALIEQETLRHLWVVPQVFEAFQRCLADGPLSVADLSAKSGVDLTPTIEAVARLAKLDAVTLRAP